MTKKGFHLGDVLTVFTGNLLSPTHMDGVHSILNHMTGDSVFTHQIPRALESCKPFILKQFPWLDSVDLNTLEHCEKPLEWLTEQEKIYGTTFEVEQLPRDTWGSVDPIIELGNMMNK